MSVSKRIKRYADENFKETLHTTLNPEGPGVVRIHMIPPVCDGDDVEASVVIINGQDVIPVNVAWSILLCEFIKEVNKYEGREVTDEEVNTMVENTVKGVRKIYPLLSKKLIKSDLYEMMNSFKQVAYGEKSDVEIDYISLDDYALYMRAPHRMDLLVSSMAKDGKWHCNQQCVHCYAAGQELANENELSTDDWKKIIDKCRKAGIPQVTFTGGEPTMRDDLIELIDHSRWFITRLNTNGRKLTKEFCEKLKNASLDSMQITFYSSEEDIHDKLVGAKGYNDTVNGIKNAIKAGLNISINTPLCTLNKDYVKTLEFLHGLGVLYVTCSGLITTGNAELEDSEKLQLSKDEIKTVLKDAVDYCYSNGMEISFTSPGWVEDEFCKELGIQTPSCGACLSNMAVTPSGNLVPCQSWLSGESYGSMLTDEWDKMWYSDACKERRDFSAQTLGVCPLRKTNDKEVDNA
ncbi:MAG: radical SAM protein [Lachnospiraceae bacterium]|nr:radical SAM protein [Lachnospiraceae bacterium]